MSEPVIFILLSSKCSGSTALQEYLAKNFGIAYLHNTGHHENETLYWTKIASVLSLPQRRMHRSEVPFSRTAAARSLQLLFSNQELAAGIPQTLEQSFEVFIQLAQKHCVLIEKSPHHLFNISNVDMILRFREYARGRARVYVMGLVRNPMDSVFSAWSRWRFHCRSFEDEWRQSYENLSAIKGQVAVFNYEQIARSAKSLDEYLHQCGLSKVSDSYRLNSRSVGKWRMNHGFRHRLSPETMRIAKELGYGEEELAQPRTASLAWKVSENVNIGRYMVIWLIKALNNLMPSKNAS